MAKMDVVDNGKPIWEARMDLETVIASLEYYGGMGEQVRLCAKIEPRIYYVYPKL